MNTNKKNTDDEKNYVPLEDVFDGQSYYTAPNKPHSQTTAEFKLFSEPLDYKVENYKREAEAMKEMITDLRNENKALRIERDTFKTCIQIMSNSKTK